MFLIHNLIFIQLKYNKICYFILKKQLNFIKQNMIIFVKFIILIYNIIKYNKIFKLKLFFIFYLIFVFLHLFFN